MTGAESEGASPAVRTDAVNGVVTITLADTENRNALSASVVGGLFEGIAAANDDPEVRAIVVTNEGNVFCAGADLKRKPTDALPGKAGPRLDELLVAIQTSPTPVIGRIDGHVVGGGMGLAAACDISIARDDAKFGFTEVRVGVAPAIISVVCLPKLRRADALDAFLRGNRFPAARAAEIGLINRAVAADELDTAVGEVVDDLRLGAPGALAAAKRLVNDVPAMDEREAFAWTMELSASLFAADEAAEGISAFVEKRRPQWADTEEKS